MKYKIVIKRDFAPYGCEKGFVVTDGVCNIMPGATWFRTIEEAMSAIRIFAEVGGDAAAFWQRLRA